MRLRSGSTAAGSRLRTCVALGNRVAASVGHPASPLSVWWMVWGVPAWSCQT